MPDITREDVVIFIENMTVLELSQFCRRVVNHTMVNEQMTRFYTGFRRDAHGYATGRGRGHC